MSCKIPDFQFDGMQLNEKPNDVRMFYDNDCQLKISYGGNINVNYTGEVVTLSGYGSNISVNNPGEVLINNKGEVLTEAEVLINNKGEVLTQGRNFNPPHLGNYIFWSGQNTNICGIINPYLFITGLNKEYVTENILNPNVDIPPSMTRDIENNQFSINGSINYNYKYNQKGDDPNYYFSKTCFNTFCPPDKRKYMLKTLDPDARYDHPVCTRELSNPQDQCNTDDSRFMSRMNNLCIFAPEYKSL